MERADRGEIERQSRHQNLFSSVRSQARRQRFFSLLHTPGARPNRTGNGSSSRRHGADFYRQRRQSSLQSRRIRSNPSERRQRRRRKSLSRNSRLCAASIDGNQSLGDGKLALGSLPSLHAVSRRSRARVAWLSRHDLSRLSSRFGQPTPPVFRKGLSHLGRPSRFTSKPPSAE